MSKRPRIFYGWWIVAAAVGVNMLISTVFVYGFGAFFVPWRNAFGWSRAQLGGVIGLSRLEGGLVAPLAGWMVDRYGPQKMMLLGFGMMGLGFLALSRISSLLSLTIVFLGLLATGSSFGGNRPVQVAVVNWFIRKRGRAMGMLMAGYAGGGSLVFLFAMVIDKFGWRVGAMVAGLLIWAIGFPLALVIRHKPEDMGLLPDGDSVRIDGNPVTIQASAQAPIADIRHAIQDSTARDGSGRKFKLPKLPPFLQRDPRPELDFTVWQAVRTPAFWLLIVIHATWAAAPVIHTVHFIPFLVEELKMEYVAATGVLSFFAFVSMFGRLGFGYIADLINIRVLATTLLAFEAIGIFLVSQSQNLNQMLFSTAVFAIAHGGVIVMWPMLQGYFFGRRHFGTIGGFTGFVQLPASVSAPVWVGYLADTIPHGYRIGLALIAVLMAIAAVCVLASRRPREPLPVDEPPGPLRMIRDLRGHRDKEEAVGLPR